jgi:hypothetical protein
MWEGWIEVSLYSLCYWKCIVFTTSSHWTILILSSHPYLGLSSGTCATLVPFVFCTPSESKLYSPMETCIPCSKFSLLFPCQSLYICIFWPGQISNNDLWTRTNQIRIDLEIWHRKWGWLGHTHRKPSREMARLALDWNSQGSQGWGRPKVAWRRTVLEEAKIIGKSWNKIKHTARNRVRWKNLVEALCSEMEWWDYIYIFHTKERIYPIPNPFVIFCNMLVLLWWEIVSMYHAQAGGPSFASCLSPHIYK